MRTFVYYILCLIMVLTFIGCKDNQSDFEPPIIDEWMPRYLLRVALFDSENNNMLSNLENGDFRSSCSKSFNIKAYFDDETETEVHCWGIGNHSDTLYLEMRVPYVLDSPIRKVTVYLNYPNAFADSLTHKFEAYYVPGSGPGGKYVVPRLESVKLDSQMCEKLDWEAVVAHLE
ncbi:MAG: hypothetical protein NC342_07125 [Pseudoflavonifractor sp.]|nr:hypothetical protein [Alloprevotella sp.]MCM1117290.1 hypothetical protein [Pseudoflavonifractor sp.]